MRTTLLFILIGALLIPFTMNGHAAADQNTPVMLAAKAKAPRVTFETSGGSKIKAQSADADGKIAAPARPTKAGWVFVGWYSDPAATDHMWDFLNDAIQEPTTLYAKWVQVDEKHRLLNAYASPEELANPYVAATLQTLGEMSADGRTLTLPEGTTVYVAPGVYWTDQTYRQGFPFDESGFVATYRPLVGLTILGDNLTFLGLTGDAKDVHIAGNRGEGGARGLGANGSWYTLAISTGFHGENITVANYAQESLEYPRDPSQNISMRINSMNHAEVMRAAEGATLDKIYFKNSRFIGYLNMMAGFSPLRAYWLNCVFQCTDDSIFGGQINVYERCTFYNCGDHPSAVAAGPGGINALLGCTMVGMPQMTAPQLNFNKVSRGNGATATSIYAIIDTKFTDRNTRAEWENIVRPDARHAVSNNTYADGRPFVISPSQPQTSVTYAGAALNAFKVGDRYNVYNLLGGADGWNPAGQDLAEWKQYSNLPYRFLIGVSNGVLFSEQTGENNTTVLTPAPAPVGAGNPEKTAWKYDESLLSGKVDPATGALTLSAKPNTTGAIVKTVVTGTLPNGTPAGATLTIRPVPVAAPVLTKPAIAITENVATLSYTLDQSYREATKIEWYREKGKNTTDGIHIGTTRNDDESRFIDEVYKAYELTKYDVGYYLRAVITPKYEFGPAAAAPITVYTMRAIAPADVTATTLATDFKNVFLAFEDHTATTGRWFFDMVNPEDPNVPWGWGIGTNGSEGLWGLMNNTRGKVSRMVFGQTGQYGDMSLVLNYSSGKVEGQGFGGSGCLLDTYIKYDPVTRTGYGLRVERVPATTSGTEWTLYHFDGTTEKALTKGVLTATFMPKSTFTLSVVGNTLRVVASTKSNKTPLQVMQELPATFDISWTDESGALAANTFGGFGFRINNSGNSTYAHGGAGTNNCVMLHNVKVEAAAR